MCLLYFGRWPTFYCTLCFLSETGLALSHFGTLLALTLSLWFWHGFVFADIKRVPGVTDSTGSGVQRKLVFRESFFVTECYRTACIVHSKPILSNNNSLFFYNLCRAHHQYRLRIFRQMN